MTEKKIYIKDGKGIRKKRKKILMALLFLIVTYWFQISVSISFEVNVSYC